MTLGPVTDHVGEMLDVRTEQFRDKERFTNVLRTFGVQIQDIENALQQLIADRALDTAVGAQLDGIGEIVGEERAGRLDADYRVAIRTRISLNLSQGTPEDLISLAQAISGGTNVELTELFPAAFEIRILDSLPSGTDPIRIATVVASGKPAGVQAITIIHVDPPFQYDTGTGYDEGKYAVATE